MFELQRDCCFDDKTPELTSEEVKLMNEFFTTKNFNFEEVKFKIIKKIISKINQQLDIGAEESQRAVNSIKNEFNLQKYIDIVVPKKRE